ncbi:MAG: hypothetical protein ACTH2Q_01380 [Propionibacteriaceae bacterium]
MSRRWADECPDALQVLVDPSIRLADDNVASRWALPAGWVRIVNGLHINLVGLVGEYEIVRVTNKMSALRYAIDWLQPDNGGPDVWQAVNDYIGRAKDESLSVCEFCGGPAEGTISFGSTRCEDHSSIPGAIARPPGWRSSAD